MKNILLLLFLTTQYLFALISIVPEEISNNPGLHGTISTTLETKKGNTDKENYKAGTRVVYDSNTSYITWGELSGEYGEVDGVADTDKLYLHLRHIHAITKEDIRWEVFGQLEKNKFKLIEKREVLGGGVRFKIFQIFESGQGYIGLGGFNEIISYTDDNIPSENNIRLNTYFAYTISLAEGSSLSYSLFYQPRYDKIHDYSKSHKLNVEVHIFKALYLNFRLSWDVDRAPPPNVEKQDFYQETTFVLKF